MDTLAATLLMLSGIFLILLVLVQRGRGGGLAGAFGGMGGQSAFGTKAGDVFTKITVVVAVVWVLLAGGSILAFRSSTGGYKGNTDPDGKASLIDTSNDKESTLDPKSIPLPGDSDPMTDGEAANPASTTETPATTDPEKKPETKPETPAVEEKPADEKPVSDNSAPEATKTEGTKPEEPKKE